MTDRVLFALIFLAAIGSGVVGGIFYAFSSFVMKALRSLPTEQGVAAMNSINVAVITPSFLLAFIGTTLLCLALAAVSFFWWPHLSGKLVFVAALLHIVSSFGVTMIVNQPLNLRLARLQPAQAVEFWPEYVQTWTLWNHVRTIVPLGCAALFIAALVLKN